MRAAMPPRAYAAILPLRRYFALFACCFYYYARRYFRHYFHDMSIFAAAAYARLFERSAFIIFAAFAMMILCYYCPFCRFSRYLYFFFAARERLLCLSPRHAAAKDIRYLSWWCRALLWYIFDMILYIYIHYYMLLIIISLSYYLRHFHLLLFSFFAFFSWWWWEQERRWYDKRYHATYIIIIILYSRHATIWRYYISCRAMPPLSCYMSDADDMSIREWYYYCFSYAACFATYTYAIYARARQQERYMTYAIHMLILHIIPPYYDMLLFSCRFIISWRHIHYAALIRHFLSFITLYAAHDIYIMSPLLHHDIIIIITDIAASLYIEKEERDKDMIYIKILLLCARARRPARLLLFAALICAICAAAMLLMPLWKMPYERLSLSAIWGALLWYPYASIKRKSEILPRKIYAITYSLSYAFSFSWYMARDITLSRLHEIAPCRHYAIIARLLLFLHFTYIDILWCLRAAIYAPRAAARRAKRMAQFFCAKEPAARRRRRAEFISFSPASFIEVKMLFAAATQHKRRIRDMILLLLAYIYDLLRW